MKKLIGLIILAPVLMLASIANAQVYDAFPVPFPGSSPSVGYAATSTDELGDHVALAGSDRSLSTVDVVLTSFTCENDPDGAPTNSLEPEEPCVTTPGTSYTHPIILNLYNVDISGPPTLDTRFATKTVTATVPFRPSWDSVNCTGAGETPTTNAPFGGKWFDPVLGFCVTGFNFVVSFDFSGMGITLPDELIYGVEFDTSVHGNNPVGALGGYDSLNLALTSGVPSIGTNVEPDTAFFDTSFAPNYCDGGAGGTDTFRRDAGCWGTFTPIVTINPDADGDGVKDGDDLCPDTVIPEDVVPTSGALNPNHWALTDGDGDFDTVLKGQGKGPNRSYTIEDTAGCSCEQIIEMQELGDGHTKHGCSISAMDDWVEAVNF